MFRNDSRIVFRSHFLILQNLISNGINMNLRNMCHSGFWSILLCISASLFFVSSCKLADGKSIPETEIGAVETGVYLKKTFETSNGVLNYRILYPKGFDKSKKYPVLLFLHGAGERGNDNEAQLVHGSDLIKKGMDIHQSIAIFPQCPKADYWASLKEVEDSEGGPRDFEMAIDGPPTDAMARVIELMKSEKDKSYVDKSRIYVAGLSMGGMGTFDLCWRMPDMFAAAGIICGAGSAEKAGVLSQMPLRIFHGDQDQVVSVEESYDMVKSIKAAGGNPEVFIYPEVNHNSWDNAFAEPDFLSWFYKYNK